MRNEGLFRPMLLALALAVGGGAVWVLFGMWAWAVAEHVAGSTPASEVLLVLADGTPVVAESGRNGGTTYRDLDGKPVERSADRLGHIFTPPLAPGPGPDGPESWEQRVHSFADGGEPAVYWYFLTDGAGGHFVGYDSRSKVRVGYLGQAGFREGPIPPGERFSFSGKANGSRLHSVQMGHNPWCHPQPRDVWRGPHGSLSGWDVYVLDDGGALHHVDLQRRTSRRVDGLPRVLSAGLVHDTGHVSVHGKSGHLAVRTADDVLVLDEHCGVMRRYAVPEALRGREFRFAEIARAEALMYSSGPQDTLATEVEYRVFFVMPGKGFREQIVTLAYSSGMKDLPRIAGLILPSPLALGGVVAAFRPGELRMGGVTSSYPEGLRRAARDYWPALVIAQLVAAALAVVCYRRQVRYGAAGIDRVAWPLFVLALGLPGYVGYRFGRAWPALEACPGCDADMPADRDACARCAASMPAPPLRGTEVFA